MKLTVALAAEREGCSIGNIHHAISSGKLPAERVGSIYLIEDAALAAWSANRAARDFPNQFIPPVNKVPLVKDIRVEKLPQDVTDALVNSSISLPKRRVA